MNEGLAVLGGWLELALLLGTLVWVVRRRASRAHGDPRRRSGGRRG